MSILGIAGGALVAALAVLGVACGITALAFLPDRQFADYPRGVFPEPGDRPRTVRFRAYRVPLRREAPQMNAATGAFVHHDACGSHMTLAALVDLACRGYLDITEYKGIGVARPMLMVSVRREPGEECDEFERALLSLLSTPGAPETLEYTVTHPFDPILFRQHVVGAGLTLTSKPVARVSGMRRSISRRVREYVSEVTARLGWYSRRASLIGSLGASLFLGGSVAVLVSLLAWLLGSLPSGWIVVSLIVTALGAISLRGTEGRTALGTVARDQVVGFRRFLTESPNGVNALGLAKFGGWAIALNCVEEWVAALERKAEEPDLARAFPWFSSTRRPLGTWGDVVDIFATLSARLHADPAAHDSRSPLPPLGPAWDAVPSAWRRDAEGGSTGSMAQ